MPILPDMIGIAVTDMAASMRFYRLLGLDIPTDKDGEAFNEVITSNGYRISWNTVEMIKGFDPDWPGGTGSRIAIAFKCDSPAEVDRVHAQIVAQGYKSHKAPWDAFWGQRYATVVDPDGFLVDLFAPLG